MQIKRVKGPKWWVALGCLSLRLVATGEVAEASSDKWRLVTPQQIAETISAAGTPVLAAQVELLGTIRAAKDARFVLEGTASRNHDVVTVRLRCEKSRDCLPFYVVLHGLSVDIGLEKLGASAADSHAETVKTSAKQEIIKGGDRATLVLESGDMRIVMPVICLQNGFRGQTIRATGRDRKKIYEAEVIETGLLRGTL